MANTITEYQRRSSGAGLIRAAKTPSTQGYNAMMSAEQAYMQGLDRLVKAGGNLYNTYSAIITDRDTRDANTEASKIFRERRLNILQTVKGKDADGLINREDEWQKSEYESFAKKYNIGSDRAKAIWAEHSDRYLDRTGAYQVEQQAAYDKQSKLMASDEATDNLIMANIGDVKAIDAVFQRNKELFPNEPMLAEQQNDKAVMVAMKNWARQNPSVAVNWFKANKESLKQQFGQKFVNADAVIAQAENQLRSEAQHAEVMAARAQRLQEKAQRQRSQQELNNFVTLAARGEGGSDALYSLTDNPDVLPSDKLTAFHFAKGLEQADKAAEQADKAAEKDNLSVQAQQMKMEQEVTSRDFSVRIAQAGGVTPEIQNDMNTQAGQGKLTSEAYRTLVSFGESQSRVPADSKPFVADAYKYIEDIYAQKNLFDPNPDPNKFDQANKIRQAITARVQSSPNTIQQDMNMNDPNSWMNQLIKANPPVKRSLQDTSGFMDPWSPLKQYNLQQPGRVQTTQEQTGTAITPDRPMTTGNSLLDKLRARGVQPQR